MDKKIPQSLDTFQSLSPDSILTAVEEALGIRCVNICRPLNSYINRVYELETEDCEPLVVKFYRPGRWSPEALEDEQVFIRDLADRELPVISPIKLENGKTLGRTGNVYFAVYPRKGGRNVDEYNDDQWLELGRLLGRVHAIGAEKKPVDRLIMSPSHSTRLQRDYICKSGLIPEDQEGQYHRVSEELLEEITPLFSEVPLTRIHGDCHAGNIIYRPGESFFLIDFDDMVVGPVVQDLWMLLPGPLDESFVEVDLFLEGYESFHSFDRRSLQLIEPLRAMRFIHYSAWCAHQVLEDGKTLVVPDFGTRSYWQKEIDDLADQIERIRDCGSPMGNV